MSDTCATVKIKDPNAPGGFVVINEEDFDEEIHTKLSAAASAKADAKLEAAAEEETAETAETGEELKPKRGSLPDDFPHVETLRAAGITTYTKARALKGDYTTVEGIGEARGLDIDAALGE